MKTRPAAPLHLRQSRMEQGRKLRAMYRSLGMSRTDCAKFLQVSERSLHNWESGRYRMPLAVFKLLRLQLGYELPGKDWDGWCISRGKLCTPEGHELSPHDAKWWSLLIRRAETGYKALGELARLKRLVGGAAGLAECEASGGSAAKPASAGPKGLRRAAPLDLSLGHFGTHQHQALVSMRVRWGESYEQSGE